MWEIEKIEEFDKEKLRRFQLPMERIDVYHADPMVKEICQEYWHWDGEKWEILCDWFKEEGTVTCLHCETEHNWKTLYEMAQRFGYEG
jgi:hypothetical protein